MTQEQLSQAPVSNKFELTIDTTQPSISTSLGIPDSRADELLHTMSEVIIKDTTGLIIPVLKQVVEQCTTFEEAVFISLMLGRAIR